MNQTDKYISYLEAEIQYLKKLLDDNGISYDYEAHLRALQSDVGDTAGTHGKIVSFEQDYYDWVLENNKFYKNHVGLYDKYDGEHNMKLVMSVPNWKYIFPAFSWCNKLGEGWYLPSIYELKSINDNIDNIDKGLRESGYRPMNRANYISSTEDETNASQIFYLWGMGNCPGEISNECDKGGGWVVAVRKF